MSPDLASPLLSLLHDAATDPLTLLAAHAASITVILRAIVSFLRSDLSGALWEQVPKRWRPLAFAALGLFAVVVENVAFGLPIADSIFVAIGGVGGAVTSHEFGSRLRKPAPVDLPPIGGA